MEKLYQPLCVAGDDLSWPMKIRSATSGEAGGAELKFSTSTREIFFTWAKTACADWVGNSSGYVMSHGDVHFGNIGTYAVDIPSIRLAVGLKDFDEAAEMPFQTDLLQAMVTLRLQARADGFDLTEPQAERAARILLSAYRQAMDSGRNATDLLLPDAKLSKLLDQNSKSLRHEVDDVVEAGSFKRKIATKKGKLKDLFRPVLVGETDKGLFTKSMLAQALVDASQNSKSFGKLVTFHSSEKWAEAIEAAAQRTRIGSGGSQGMSKVMVHVRSGVKLAGGTTDAIIYLKQACTSAAERTGYVPVREPVGGRRVWVGNTQLTAPEIAAVSWCELGGRSYLVDIRNPWESEPEVHIRDEDELEWGARLLGTCLGTAHCNARGGVEASAPILRQINRKLETDLVSRSAAFMVHNREALGQWASDPRVADLRQKADKALEAQ